MAFFEDLSRKVQDVAFAAAEKGKEVAAIASEKAQDAADTVKTNVAIAGEQRAIEKNYRAIGEWYVSELKGEAPEAGADIVTFHYEATYDPRGCIEMIRKAGAKAGVSIKPATSVEVLRDILPLVDLVLVMSVEPGFGGQSFIPASIGKIEALRAMARELGLQTVIEVDGGISSHNAREVYQAGADVLVAGNAVFGAADPQAEIVRMLNA